MKNEIVTRKVIERGKDWLRIGNIVIPIIKFEDKKIIKYTEEELNTIYLKDLDERIDSENINDLFNKKTVNLIKENLSKEKVGNIIEQMIECNIGSFDFGEGKTTFFNGILGFSDDTPSFYTDEFKDEPDIYYNIEFLLENWKKPYTYLELKDKLEKEFKDNKVYNFLFEDNYHLRIYSRAEEFTIKLYSKFYKDKTVDELNEIIWNLFKKAYEKIEKEYNGGEQMKFFIDDPDLKFAMKQYLIGFPEFIRKITGKIIQFEIETDSDGLRFKIGKNEKLEDIKEELLKYMRLLNNGDSINFELLNNLGLTQIQLIGVKSFVDTQVMTFKHQIIQSNILLSSEREKSEYLLKTSERIEKLFNKHIECNKIENFNLYALNNNHLENKNTIKIDINFNENIEKLQESIFEMKNLLNPLINDLLKEELQEIDDRLMEINDSQELNKNKGIIGKLKRFVNGIKNISGTVILAGQAINISGETFQRLLELKSTILNIISELGK